MTIPWRSSLKIKDFEWDEGNVLHLELGHGIEPEEAEEVFLNKLFYRRTRKGHYVAFSSTLAGRYLTLIFELKTKGWIRVITGWDMKRAEIQYYMKHRR
jgi:uncharacterized protein